MNSRAIKIASDLMTILDNQCRDTDYACEYCELYSENPEHRRICDMIVESARIILKETVNE